MTYYGVTNVTEYAAAIETAKSDCKKALSLVCADIANGDAKIRYEEEDDTTINGGASRIIASAAIKMPKDKGVFLSTTCGGVDRVSVCIFGQDGEIEISCMSYPIMDVSEEE